MAPKWEKPLPVPTALSRPFWDGTQNHEIRLQRCDQCAAYRFPPVVLCRACLAEEHQWVPTSGRGTIYSYVIQHRPATPAFIDDLPYVVAIVELDEGPLMLTNIVGCSIDEIEVGLAVEATFVAASTDITLYPFTLRRDTSN